MTGQPSVLGASGSWKQHTHLTIWKQLCWYVHLWEGLCVYLLACLNNHAQEWVNLSWFLLATLVQIQRRCEHSITPQTCLFTKANVSFLKPVFISADASPRDGGGDGGRGHFSHLPLKDYRGKGYILEPHYQERQQFARPCHFHSGLF